MRAIKKFFKEVEYTDGELMFIEICMTFGLVCVVLAEFAKVIIG